MNLIANLIVPVLILFIIIYALKKRVNVYDSFVDGAKEGIGIGIGIFPYLLGMMFAINILIKSNALGILLDILAPFFNILKIPLEIIPMAIMRPISGSATLVLMNEVFISSGVDSFVGKLASIIQGGNDTTLYIITLYFGVVGIKKIKQALWLGLLVDLVGVIISIIVIDLLY